MVDGVEHELDPGGDAQLVENPKQVLLVMACSLRSSSRAVSRLLEALGDKGDNLLLAWGEKLLSAELITRSEGTSEIRSSRKVICSVLAQI